MVVECMNLKREGRGGKKINKEMEEKRERTKEYLSLRGSGIQANQKYVYVASSRRTIEHVCFVDFSQETSEHGPS